MPSLADYWIFGYLDLKTFLFLKTFMFNLNQCNKTNRTSINRLQMHNWCVRNSRSNTNTIQEWMSTAASGALNAKLCRWWWQINSVSNCQIFSFSGFVLGGIPVEVYPFFTVMRSFLFSIQLRLFLQNLLAFPTSNMRRMCPLKPNYLDDVTHSLCIVIFHALHDQFSLSLDFVLNAFTRMHLVVSV